MRNLRILAVLLGMGVSGHAYIDAMNSTLDGFNGGFKVIAEGTVEKVDVEKKIGVIRIGKVLKGATEVTHVRLNIGVLGGAYPEAILKHLVPGAPVVVWYYWGAGPKSAVYLNRFFLELWHHQGESGQDPARPWWFLNAVATSYNRTYNGSVEELVPLLRDMLAGKTKGPAVDLKPPPITCDTMKALPVWGSPSDPRKLPLPFRRSMTATPSGPLDPANPGPLAAGLQVQAFEGTWNALPDFARLKPSRVGTSESIGLTARPRDAGYALVLSGFLDVPKDGVYTFSLVSNDGARLRLGNTDVVDNDHHKMAIESRGEVSLKAGKHAIRLEYFQDSGFQVLEAYWQGPGLARERIPASALWRSR
jgi:hypothetical protein